MDSIGLFIFGYIFDKWNLLQVIVAISTVQVVGSSTGDMITLDMRNCSQPVSVNKRSNYTVTSLSNSDR